jgi:hypothetical protein
MALTSLPLLFAFSPFLGQHRQRPLVSPPFSIVLLRCFPWRFRTTLARLRFPLLPHTGFAVLTIMRERPLILDGDHD